MKRQCVASIGAIGLAVGLLGGCGGAGLPDALSGPQWRIAAASSSGVAIDPPTGALEGSDWSFVDRVECVGCPDAPGVVGYDGCNSFTRTIEADDATITWGDFWESTAAGCSSPFHDAVNVLFQSDAVEYDVAGDQLTLSTQDDAVSLTLVAVPVDGELDR